MREVIRTLCGSGLLLVGIMLIASTMRAPTTSVGLVLTTFRETTAISAAEGGILTTIPVLDALLVATVGDLAGRATI